MKIQYSYLFTAGCSVAVQQPRIRYQETTRHVKPHQTCLLLRQLALSTQCVNPGHWLKHLQATLTGEKKNKKHFIYFYNTTCCCKLKKWKTRKVHFTHSAVPIFYYSITVEPHTLCFTYCRSTLIFHVLEIGPCGLVLENILKRPVSNILWFYVRLTNTSWLHLQGRINLLSK